MKASIDGATLRKLREGMGISQERLAARAGLTMQTVSRIERGKVNISHPLTIVALAKALDVDAQLLMAR